VRIPTNSRGKGDSRKGVGVLHAVQKTATAQLWPYDIGVRLYSSASIMPMGNARNFAGIDRLGVRAVEQVW